MAKFINFVVDGRVFFNISIGLDYIRFRLIIVVITDKILHRVVRKELLEFAGQLRCQSFVVGND